MIHAATPDAIKPFLISYFILAFGSDDDSYICIFILFDQAKPPITCRLSFLFLAPQNRHNLQYPNKRWLAKIYMGVVKGEKTSAGLL